MAKKKNLGCLTFIVVLAIIVAVLILARDILIKMSVERAAKAVTGLPLHMDKLRVGFRSTIVDIKGLKVYNPLGFEEELMLNAPAIFFFFFLKNNLKGYVLLYVVWLYIADFFVVK